MKLKVKISALDNDNLVGMWKIDSDDCFNVGWLDTDGFDNLKLYADWQEIMPQNLKCDEYYIIIYYEDALSERKVDIHVDYESRPYLIDFISKLFECVNKKYVVFDELFNKFVEHIDEDGVYIVK